MIISNYFVLKGGYMSSSLAIATDAAHLLTDFASFMVSLFALWVGSRPPTKKMSFGWYRAEVIGALTSVLMIWVVVAILVYLAVDRVMHLNFQIEAEFMLITSGIGVLVNLMSVDCEYSLNSINCCLWFQHGLYVASARSHARARAHARRL